LKGNRFSIALTGLASGDHDRAQSCVDILRGSGLPNYFGEQRFGYRGRNVAEALSWLGRSKERERKKARFYEKLYPSVLQAEVFNRYLTRRFRQGLSQLIEGEVVRLAGSGSVFVVEDVATEQPRLSSADLVLTGPIFGPRAVAAKGAAAELESEALQALGLSETQLTRLGKAARGTRRDLIIELADLRLVVTDESSLQLVFSLPAGSYATQLIRELVATPWLGLRS
jgi:tRNA pseudouridine13 synthase